MTDTNLSAIAEAVILQPWLAAVPASVVLQLVALVWLKGVGRAISAVLTVVTATVCGLVASAYTMEPGNLWQLLLHLAGPPLFVLTSGTLLMGLVLSPRTFRKRRESQHRPESWASNCAT